MVLLSDLRHDAVVLHVSALPFTSLLQSLISVVSASFKFLVQSPVSLLFHIVSASFFLGRFFSLVFV